MSEFMNRIDWLGKNTVAGFGSWRVNTAPRKSHWNVPKCIEITPKLIHKSGSHRPMARRPLNCMHTVYIYLWYTVKWFENSQPTTLFGDWQRLTPIPSDSVWTSKILIHTIPNKISKRQISSWRGSLALNRNSPLRGGSFSRRCNYPRTQSATWVVTGNYVSMSCQRLYPSIVDVTKRWKGLLVFNILETYRKCCGIVFKMAVMCFYNWQFEVLMLYSFKLIFSISVTFCPSELILAK
jgi:hypothetical protein